MKRTAYLTVGLALVLVVTGAIASRIWAPHHYEAVVLDNEGHTWYVSGNFAGQIALLNPRHQPIGYIGSTGDGTGQAILRGFGETFTFSGSGEHSLQDRSGHLLGYVILSPKSMQEAFRETGWSRHPRDARDYLRVVEESWKQHPEQMGVSGNNTNVAGMIGYDKRLELRWEVLGVGSLQVLRASDHQAVVQDSNVKTVQINYPDGKLPPFIPTTPQITVTFEGKMSIATGYGEHAIQDGAGHTQYLLKVSRP